MQAKLWLWRLGSVVLALVLAWVAAWAWREYAVRRIPAQDLQINGRMTRDNNPDPAIYIIDDTADAAWAQGWFDGEYLAGILPGLHDSSPRLDARGRPAMYAWSSNEPRDIDVLQRTDYASRVLLVLVHETIPCPEEPMAFDRVVQLDATRVAIDLRVDPSPCESSLYERLWGDMKLYGGFEDSPYTVIAIDRADIAASVREFVLYDQFGSEMARAAWIP